MNRIWDRGYLTNTGPCEREFEGRLAALVGVRHSVATCNATIALAILCRALGLRGEVLLPSFTFIATAHAIEWQGLTPVFCEIEAVTHNIDPADVERRITPRTTAILAVHLWGRPAPIEALTEVAARHGLRLIFDAAHAVGCTYRGTPVGGFGDAEVFSLHATKVLNTFEGGVITTNDDALAERLRRMRNFGFTDYDLVESVGMNAKMSEVAAAMGLTSLESLDRFVASNRQIYADYGEALAGLPGIALAPYDETEQHNFQYVVTEIDAQGAGLTRDEVQRVLWAEGIRARRYFYPGCHRAAPYADRPAVEPLPVTEEIASRVLCLPTGSSLTSQDVARIGAVLSMALRDAAAVRERLAASAREAGSLRP